MLYCYTALCVFSALLEELSQKANSENKQEVFRLNTVYKFEVQTIFFTKFFLLFLQTVK